MAVSEHCTITAKLRRFSFFDSVSAEYECDGKHFNRIFKATFYPNGSCVANRGHVSIIFNVNNPNFNGRTNPVTFSCVASVVDAAGNERFPQSLALDLYDLYNEDISFFTKGFGFDKFLKRGTLLSDSPELLPDDCLSLHLEIDLKVILNVMSDFRKYDTHGFVEEDGRWYLRMDSEFGRDMCEMSTVFRDMMEFTIAESGSDRIPIPEEEYIVFRFIFDFLAGFTSHVTLSGMRKAYVLADKYDMQPIVQIFHRLLISMLRAINTQEKLECVDKHIHMIFELADRFEDDERLREILEIYSAIKTEVEGGNRDFDASNACELETEWNCDIRIENNSLVFFVFRRKKYI